MRIEQGYNSLGNGAIQRHGAIEVPGDQAQEESSGFFGINSVKDVMYILWRHKWKIGICSLLGFIGAAVVFLMQPKLYESQAKLLVKYIVDEAGLVDGINRKVQTGGGSSRGSGDSVIGAEIAILGSWDLAVNTARSVGVERFVENPQDPESAAIRAASKIVSNTEIIAPKESKVITVAYRNEDPAMAVDVLGQLVSRYRQMHKDIHRAGGDIETLNRQADQVRAQLVTTEAELNRLKGAAGILSVGDSYASLNAQMARIKDEIMTTDTELGEQKAKLEAIQRIVEGRIEDEGNDGQQVAVQPNQPSSDDIQQYRTLVELYSHLRRRNLDLLLRFTSQNSVVKANDAQLEKVEKMRREMIAKFPSLAAIGTNADGTSNGPDLLLERARLEAIKARGDILKRQEEFIEKLAAQLADEGDRITKQERKRDREQQKLDGLEDAIEQAKIAIALDPSKMGNIETIQNPSVPSRVAPEGAKKTILGFALGGILVGIGLAFLIELFLDPTVKRPEDIEIGMQMPLMISVPMKKSNDHLRLVYSPEDASVGKDTGENGKSEDGLTIAAHNNSNGAAVSPWDPDHFMRPYADAIRDRLGCYFELKRMTHNPKLVALTSFKEGAGTSTLAAGLATAFSETGHGKVLLIDMNAGDGEIHPFFEGKPVCTPTEALQSGQDLDIRFKAADKYLFLATASKADEGSEQFVPKRLYDLMPQFKVSDFDYIIFDMPPIGPTSPTVAMSGFMDKVLLVVDAEETRKDELRRGYADLAAGKAAVSCVFNKAREDMPNWLPS